MANTAAIKRGWHYDRVNSRLEAYVDGTEFLRASTSGLDFTQGTLNFTSGSTGTYVINLRANQADALSITDNESNDLMIFDTDGARSVTVGPADGALSVLCEATFSRADGITLSGSSRLNFRTSGGYPNGNYINSPSAGKITMYATSTAADAIVFNAGADNSGTIKLYGYLGLHVTDTDGNGEGELWMDNSEDALKFYGGGAVNTVADSAHGFTFNGDISMSGTNGLLMTGATKLSFRDNSGYPNGNYINSPSAGKMTIYCASTASDAFVINTGATNTGTIKLYGYFNLGQTTTASTTKGNMWYDTSDNYIKYYNGSESVSLGAFPSTGGLITGANRLNFRDDGPYPGGTYVNSPATGKITWYCSSTAADAFVINTGADNSGTIKLYGYLCLHITDTDSDTEGEIWYDNSENKLKFYNGTAVETVTSST